MWRRCQLSSGSDVSRNLEEAVQLVNVAADRGAQYVQLPEYFQLPRSLRGFATLLNGPGPTTIRMAELAGHAP